MSSETRRRLFLTAGLLLLGGCAAPKPPELPPQWPAAAAAAALTHADCVRLALATAATAADWRARVAAADAALARVRRLPNPTLVVEWEDLGLDHGPEPVPVQRTYSLVTSLADLLAMPWRIDAAEYERMAAAADVQAERDRLAARVSGDYDALVAARRRVALVRELAQVAERQRAAAAEFVSVGLRPALELERAAAEVEDARAELFRAEAEERERELALAFALGFERPVSLTLADPMSAPTAAEPPDLEALLAAALEKRPEIVAATARFRAALERERLKTWRVELLPSFTVGRRRAGSEKSYVAGIDVSLPLFDQGQPAVAEASAELLAAAAALRATTQEVTAEVCSAAQRLESATAIVERHARPLAERRQAIRAGTERLFAAGEVPFDDLLTTRRDEVAARLALLEAELDRAAARVALDGAIGRVPPLAVPAGE